MLWWTKNPANTAALVLSGGGTRGAYEAGVINYIRTALPKKLLKHCNFKILIGSSVGSVNACFMASHSHNLELQAQQLQHLWLNLKTKSVYKRGALTYGKFLLRSSFGSIAKMLGIKDLINSNDDKLLFKAIFDTRPFQAFLTQHCALQNIEKNIRLGHVQALAVSATNLKTGNVEVFVDKDPKLNFVNDMNFVFTPISVQHIMASAALPVLFPPVEINKTPYNDGGLRMNTPLKPAISLGANKILVIGTSSTDEYALIQQQEQNNNPGIGEILGRLFEATFVDRLDTDIHNLKTTNKMHSSLQTYLSKRNYLNFCKETNTRKVDVLNIAPSINISRLVDDQLKHSYKKLKSVGTIEKAMIKIFEIDENKGTELLSYFLFEPNYIKQLLQLGYNDAKAKHDELCAFAESLIPQ